MRFELETARVFEYFEKICKIPHGSGNMDKISRFCMEFAKENSLSAICDEAKNVIIYKDGTSGYENAAPIILQGHIDMVCQSSEKSDIDFECDGIETYKDGDFIKAKETTLGADNGIAVAMVMAILSSKNLEHPPIEAVFTTDEEIGMVGAKKLDITRLRGKRMINIDAEQSDVLTVSCAGGSDVRATMPIERRASLGTKVVIEIKGLQGGHSGVEIDKGRVNSNILLGRVLCHINKRVDFEIIGINGGTKGNAIPLLSRAELVTEKPDELVAAAEEYFDIVKKEISSREKNACITTELAGFGEYNVLAKDMRDRILYMLLTTPNGVIDMSCEINGLVETSLNMGILATNENSITILYTIRSNKKTAIDFMEEKMSEFVRGNGCEVVVSGRYEPWEFKENSPMQKMYIDAYTKKFSKKPNVEAIHAGLECAVFSGAIEDLDCIAIGPDIFGAHTTEECLSISSTKAVFELLCEILKEMKI